MCSFFYDLKTKCVEVLENSALKLSYPGFTRLMGLKEHGHRDKVHTAEGEVTCNLKVSLKQVQDHKPVKK